MFSLLLLSATVTVTQPFHLENGARTIDRIAFTQALNAPVRPRTDKDVRYCIRTDVDLAREQVCRSKREWRRLGVEPLHG